MKLEFERDPEFSGPGLFQEMMCARCGKFWAIKINDKKEQREEAEKMMEVEFNKHLLEKHPNIHTAYIKRKRIHGKKGQKANSDNSDKKGEREEK